jgi:hypothetical protein
VGEASGWLQGGKVVLDNLRVTKAPAKCARLDLAEEARAALASNQGEKGQLPLPDFGGDESMAPFNTKLRYVFWAAWLYRRGEHSLAEELMARVRKETPEWEENPPLLEAAAFEIAAEEFNQAILAFMDGADDEALIHVERLMKMKAAEEFEDGPKLLEELKRRKAEGSFGRTGANPKSLSIPALIEDLEHVCARQYGQPGGVCFSDDPRVKELIARGEEAVPTLLECLQRDTRYTRSIEFHRDFSPHRYLLPVRYPAVIALIGILGVSRFPAVGGAAQADNEIEQWLQELAVEIPAYWKSYGSLPFQDRMMKMLRDPRMPEEALRQAARNIAFPKRELFYDQIIWPKPEDTDRVRPHQAIAKLTDPRAAEAIFAALEVDRKGDRDYLESLIELGDVRITPKMNRRADFGSSIADRAKYAEVSMRLGDAAAMNRIADDFTKNGDSSGRNALARGAVILARSGLPSCERALQALADPRHPNHADAADIAVNPGTVPAEAEQWRLYPFFLGILRTLLDNVDPSGFEWRAEGDSVNEIAPNKFGYTAPASQFGLDPAQIASSASGRKLDGAMKILHRHVWGAPSYHPLLRDADRRVAEARRLLDVFRGRLRRFNEVEERALGFNSPSIYVPDIRPLDRPATAEDVAHGRAVFHLGGTGKARKLDRHGAYLKGTRTPVILLQAEESSTGETVYGVVGEGLFGMKTAAELDFTIPK